jgi:hypothetical protein
MLRIFGIAVLLLGAAVAAFAADVSGKWTGDMPARQSTAPATFVFKVDGDKLTGTMTGPQGEAPLQDGKVSGDEISFSTQGGQAKILFKGTVSGDTIKMTRTREGGQGREFTLKRAQ